MCKLKISHPFNIIERLYTVRALWADTDGTLLSFHFCRLRKEPLPFSHCFSFFFPPALISAGVFHCHRCEYTGRSVLLLQLKSEPKIACEGSGKGKQSASVLLDKQKGRWVEGDDAQAGPGLPSFVGICFWSLFLVFGPRLWDFFDVVVERPLLTSPGLYSHTECPSLALQHTAIWLGTMSRQAACPVGARYWTWCLSFSISPFTLLLDHLWALLFEDFLVLESQGRS